MNLKRLLLGVLTLMSVSTQACYFDPTPNIVIPVIGYYIRRYNVPTRINDTDILTDLGEVRLPFTMYSILSASRYSSEGFGTINRIRLEYKVIGTTNWVCVKDYTTDATVAQQTGAIKVNWEMNFDNVVALFGREVINDPALKGQNIIIRMYVASDLQETGDLSVDLNVADRFAYWTSFGSSWVYYRNGTTYQMPGGWKPGYVFTAAVSTKAGIRR